MPGWLAPGPIETFQRLHARSVKLAHPLQPLLDSVFHFFGLAQLHAQREFENLEPLKDRFLRTLVVYPGTEETYRSWEPLHKPCLAACHLSLANPLNMCTASVEFLWRSWEVALELGADPDQPDTIDPDRILGFLADRADTLGNPELLVAECSLNRYFMPRSGAGSYVTDSEEVADLVSVIRDRESDQREEPDQTLEVLTFFFFDQILQQYTNPLSRNYAPQLAKLMTSQAEPLQRLREKCSEQALGLLSNPPNKNLLEKAILQSLRNMTDEACIIADSDSRTMASYFSQLSQNPTVWGTVAGLLGSLTTPHDVVTASFAVAGLSVLGASAMEARSKQKGVLKSSPWSFVYYARRTK